MDEFREVIKQFKRLCKSVNPIKCTRGECPMGCENIGQCRKFAFERSEKFEEQVMKWAAEHPEPVYPTWGEWLCDMHVVGVQARKAPLRNVYYPVEGKMSTSIPADIAEKLGIEPKRAK